MAWSSDQQHQYYLEACWNCRISALPEHLTSPTGDSIPSVNSTALDWGLESGARSIWPKFRGNTAFCCYFSASIMTLTCDSIMFFLIPVIVHEEKKVICRIRRIKFWRKGQGGLCCSSIQPITKRNQILLFFKIPLVISRTLPF